MTSLWKPASKEFTDEEKAQLAAELAVEGVVFTIEPKKRGAIAGHLLTALPPPPIDPDIPDVDSFTLRPYV